MIRWPCVHYGATTHCPENCLFISNLCMNPEEDHIHYPPQHTLKGSNHHPFQVMYLTLDNPVTVDQPCHIHTANGHNGLAMPSTIQSVISLPATSYTCVKYVVPTTVLSSAQTRTVPLSKPTPWALLWPFILKHELSDHPSQAFIKWILMTSAMVALLATKDHSSLIARITWCLHINAPQLSTPLYKSNVS